MKLFNQSISTKFLIVLFLLCFGIRLCAVLLMPQTGSDSGKYLQLANSVRTTGVFSYTGQTPTDSRAPLYPLFLVGIQSVSDSGTAIRIAQAFLDSISCIILFFVASTIFSSTVIAYVSSILFLFHPEIVGSNTFILSETLTIFLLLCTFLLCVMSLKTKSLTHWGMSGLLLGLTTLCRPVTLLFPPFAFILGILFVRRAKKHFLGLLFLFIVFIATLAPWTIRNYIVFEEFIPVSSNAGGNLFIASKKAWNGTYNNEILAIRTKIGSELPSDALGHYHVDNELKKRALATIKADVPAYFSLCFRRFFELWCGIPGGKEMLKGHYLITNFIYLYHYVMVIFALYGCSHLVFKKSINELHIAAISFILYFTLIHCALVALPRYRIPIIPMFLLFSAYGMVSLFRRFNERRTSGTA